MGLQVLPPTTQKTGGVAMKERKKARTLLLMAVPKRSISDVFMAWISQESGQPIKDKFLVERQTQRKCKKLLDALCAGCSDEAANHKFLRSLPPAVDSLAMTMRTKKNIDTLSIDDLYNNLSVFEQDIQKTSSSSQTSDNVAFLSQTKASSSKHKPSHNSGSYSTYNTSSSKATPTATPDQIDDLDLEEMDINWQIAMTAIKIKKFYKKTGRRPRVDGKMHVAFDKRKVECFNCHNTGHFARECKFKGQKMEAAEAKQTTDEELNHALMAFTVNNEVSIPTVSNVSSISFSICPSNDSDGELGTVSGASSTHYSTCQSNDSDGEPGTVSDHSVNDDPVSTQKTQPKVPTLTQTVDPSCAQHVKPPRQPIRTPVTPSPIPSYKRQNWNQRMERELGAGYSFERKPCFVCGSLSHLIKNCDYYEKKMAREAALKSQRVVHADVRQATPAWTNTNRVNKANQFTPRPVQLSNIRPNFSTASRTIKTGRVNVNTGKQNVSSGSKHVNAGSVHFNSGTQFKSGASRFNTGKQHVNSGRMYVNSGTQNKSGSSRVNTGKQNVNTARVNRPVLSNQTSQVNLRSPKKCFSKQSSPVNRPFSRNTAYKSNIYAVKGKMGTAVKTSAGGIGHRWMFDLDYLTDSMNYIPVSLQNQANPAGSKEVIDIDVQTEEAEIYDGKELVALALKHLGPSTCTSTIPSTITVNSDIDVTTNPATMRIHNASSSNVNLGDPNTPVQTRSSLKKITEAHALSAIAHTRADGSLEIIATIDTIRYTISEASIRDSLQLDSEDEDLRTKGMEKSEMILKRFLSIQGLVTLPNNKGTCSGEYAGENKGQETGKLPMMSEKLQEYYTNEDWDLIRAKLEANAECPRSMLERELHREDFAKADGSLNQGTWKINQLKKLSFAEVKEEFDKLVKQIESFAPISFEATKASLKRFGEELQTKTPKRLKEDKDDESKEENQQMKSGKEKERQMEVVRDSNERYGVDAAEDKLEKEFWKC
ncbi:ribonuclease H-like domain-containing protein [Tanacetum coccineum]